MRHRLATKHFNRTSKHRTAMRRNMAASLIQYGSIRTTEAKAKHLRRFIEKIITVAKKGTLHARRQVIARLQDRGMYTYDEKTNDYEIENKTVVQKLFDEIAPRYAERNGGYTRIIHLAERRIGDAGRQVILQLIEDEPSRAGLGGEGKRNARAAKRMVAAGGAESAEKTADNEEAVDQAPEEDPEAVEEATVEDAPAEEAPEEEDKE